MRGWLLLLATLTACGTQGPGREHASPVEPLTHAPVPPENLLREPLPAGTPPPAPPPVAPVDPLESFRAAVHAVRAGGAGALARVAHLGDSHTAAEVLTGRLRALLQAELGDGGHGFVVPAWPDARLHRGVVLRDSGGWTVDRVRYRDAMDPGDRLFGIGTVSVRAETAGTWAQLTASGSSFDIYYLEAPGGGAFDVLVDGGPAERVATAGPAPRAAFHRVEVPDSRHVLQLRVVGDGSVRLFGVQIEHPGPGLVYSSLGVTGARVSTPLEWNEDLFKEQLRRMKPDLIVVMYGTNDLFAEDYSVDHFGTRMGELLARARLGAPGASCLVLAPPDVAREGLSGLASIPELVPLVARARVEAEREGCAFWDTLAAMGGPGSILTWRAARPPLAARDHVHLTRGGYEKLADALAAELLVPATRESP